MANLSGPRILALGGASLAASSNDARLHEYLLELSGQDRPRVCFIGAAGGDNPEALAAFYSFFARRAEATHLALFDRRVDDIESFLLDQDVIYVGDGNTANLLAIWRTHRVDAVVRKAWQQGVILAGSSAGAICWFEGGISDSFGPRLAAMRDGLKLLPGSFCPHYDSESLRRPRFAELVASGELQDGYAADDSVGLLFAGTELAEVVAVLPETRAVFVARRRARGRPDSVEETAIRPRILR